MNQTFLGLLFCLIAGPKLAIAQVFDKAGPLPAREQIILKASKDPLMKLGTPRISFNVKLADRDTEKTSSPDNSNPRDFQQQIGKSGGESGGGGNFLELKLTAAIQKMFEALKIKNRDGINLQTLKFFIESTTIIFSDNIQEFYLKTDVNSDRRELRDAVNFFPNERTLKLYAPAWKTYFALNMDVEDLLYHEFALFFFANDKNYSRSKSAELGPLNSAILTLVIGNARVSSSDSDNSIQVDAETLERKERILIYCRKGETEAMHFYYYRGGHNIANTNSSAINPFNRCDSFEEIKDKIIRASRTCPVIIDLDRKSIDNGNIALLGVRTTCY